MIALPLSEVLPDFDTMCHWIETTYAESSDLDREQGLLWYPLAHLFAETVGRGSITRGAGIIAALSPLKSWEENKRLALNARTGPITGHFAANNRKALAIRQGHEPLDVLGGNKVRAFYACIVDPSNPYDVCIDRHAFDIAHGYVTNDLARKVLERKGGYDWVADAYRKVAVNLSVPPSTLQAITWLAWRRSKRNNASSFTSF